MEAILLEVSHLHFPPYIKDLFDGGIEVVVFCAKSAKFERNILSYLDETGIRIGRNH